MAHFSLLVPRSKLNLSSRLFNNTHMNQAQVSPVFSIHWGSSHSFLPHWSKTCDCDFKPYNFQKHFDFPPLLIYYTIQSLSWLSLITSASCIHLHQFQCLRFWICFIQSFLYFFICQFLLSVLSSITHFL